MVFSLDSRDDGATSFRQGTVLEVLAISMVTISLEKDERV